MKYGITFGTKRFYGQAVYLQGKRIGNISFQLPAPLTFSLDASVKSLSGESMSVIAERLEFYKANPSELVHTSIYG